MICSEDRKAWVLILQVISTGKHKLSQGILYIIILLHIVFQKMLMLLDSAIVT